MVYNALLLTPSFFTKEHKTTYLPAEMWDIIFDYKTAMEAKDKHNALTKDLTLEVNKWASQPYRRHFTNDIWWWMTEDGEKVVRPAIYQDEETGEYEEDFNYQPEGECRCPSYNCKNVGTIYSEEYDEKVCADCDQEHKNATEWM
tara:strand:+ start:165 stop:599 length:435 start_codon:yes stop_codon:yes gene_type:complete